MIKYLAFNRMYGTRRISDLRNHHTFADGFILPVGSVLHTTNNFALEYGKDIQVTPNSEYYKWLLNTNSKRLCLFANKVLEGPVTPDISNIKFRAAGVAAKIKKYKSESNSMVRLVKSGDDFSFSQMFQNVVCHEPLNSAIITGINKKRKLFDATLASVINHIAAMPNFDHFVKVELGDTPLEYTEFMRTFKTYSRVTVLKPNDGYWMFIMHLLGALHDKGTNSFLEMVNKDVLDRMNIVFTCNNSFMIVTVGKLLEFKEDNKQIPKLLISSLNLMHAEEATAVDPIDEHIVTVKPNNKQLNATSFVETPSKDEYLAHNREAIEQLDNTMISRIVNDNTLTDKKKKYAASLAVKYKDIVVDGKTLLDWMEEPPEVNLDDAKVEAKGITDTLPDKSHTESKINKFDVEYVKKMARRDLVNQLVSFNKQGLYLQELSFKDTSDTLTNAETVVARYKDAGGTIHRMEFTIPKIDEDGYCKINGNLKKMALQRVNLPICKVAPDRVSISSNYNKAIVERIGTKAHSLEEHMRKLLDKSEKVEYVKDRKLYTDIILPYEYTAMAKITSSLSTDNASFVFDYDSRFNDVSSIDTIKGREKKLGVGSVYIGTYNKHDCYLLVSGKLVEMDGSKTVNTSSLLDVLYSELDDVKMPKLTEWANMTLLNTKLPVMFVLSYIHGFMRMLKYLNCTFSTYPLTGGTRPVLSAMDIRFVFEDSILVVENPTALQRLIVSGMSYFNLKDFNVEDLNSKDAYFDLIQQKKQSINYLRGIDTMFELFMDPITVDILLQMHEPTNLKDLIIRAVSLITTEDHDEASANSNFRYRSYERINAIIYKNMARAMSKKLSKGGSQTKFTISKYDIMSAISTDPLMENVDILNPIGAIKDKSRYSHLGDGGRSKESMVIRDRRYTKDSVGIISEASPDNGDVGITGYLTMNPNMVNLRGMAVGIEPEKIEPAQTLSITGMLFPGANMNDGKRMNFINIQIAHFVPVVGMDQARIRTGAERMIAHMAGSKFAYPAPQDGKVVKIDNDSKYIVVAFKDGTLNTLNFGPSYEKDGGGGFYSEQNIAINDLAEGNRFKKNDILLYNSDFFFKDPFSKQVDMSLGVYKTIALVENNNTIEDASEISKELGDALEFHPVMMRRVVVKKSTVVHSIATVGVDVTPVDPIIVFNEADVGDMDTDTVDILARLNRSTPKAKYAGKIVRIEAYYKGDMDDMTPSLRKVVRMANKMDINRNKAKSAASGTDIPEVGKVSGDRVDFVHMDSDTVVLKFYIKETMNMVSGDKVVYGGSLKSVVSSVFDTPVTTESGIKLDATMSATSVSNRIVLLPIYIGILERCMETIESEAVNAYFK